MPLIKSAARKAVGENYKAERDAGKPKTQALAIALSTQDRAKTRRSRLDRWSSGKRKTTGE